VPALVAYPVMRWAHDRVLDMTVIGFRLRARWLEMPDGGTGQLGWPGVS
jgi:hypothetical protein